MLGAAHARLPAQQRKNGCRARETNADTSRQTLGIVTPSRALRRDRCGHPSPGLGPTDYWYARALTGAALRFGSDPSQLECAGSPVDC